MQVALYGLAAAVAAPVGLVLSAMVLGGSEQPVFSAWMFCAGAASLAAAISAIALASGLLGQEETLAAWLDIGIGSLFAVIGIKALVGEESPEKDAARRARAEGIAKGSLRSLFLAGIAVQVINFDAIAIFTGALSAIASAEVATAQAVVAVCFGLAIMLSVYYLPIIVYLASPSKARPLLTRMTESILGNGRKVELSTGFAFGAMFLGKGLEALL